MISNKTKINLALLLLAGVIGFSTLLITNRFVKQLAEEERKKIDLWALGIKQLTNLTDSLQDYTFVFEVIQNNNTVPVVLADELNNIISYRNINEKDLVDSVSINQLIAKMQSEHDPIEIQLLDGSKNFVYFMDSTTLKKLALYPYIQFFILLLFLGVAYYAYSQSRKAEQNRIWVGLAKETAHQLGTPTSSLMACLTMLRDGAENPLVLNELEKDVLRLEKITDRFSKIGSTQNLELQNLVAILDKSTDYLVSRISKSVEFTKNYNSNDKILVPLNETLIEWVIENIVKNSVDAMNGNGRLSFNIIDNTQVVFLDIVDTGKGIPRSKFKEIFQPGYTTKDRGWGLGLSLAKRIIEEYHHGKIFVLKSEIDKGTTLRIVLKKSSLNYGTGS